MHGYRCEMKSCRPFIVLLSHTYRMAAGKDKDGKHTLIPLCRAVHHRLVMMSVFVGVALEVEHEHLDHVAITGGCRQMDRLRAHVAVPVLRHRSLGYVVVREFVPHRVQDQTGLLEADQLEHVHVVVEAQIQVLFLRQIEKPKRFDVVLLYVLPNFRHPHRLLRLRSSRSSCVDLADPDRGVRAS